jgi:hypothetical protein
MFKLTEVVGGTSSFPSTYAVQMFVEEAFGATSSSAERKSAKFSEEQPECYQFFSIPAALDNYADAGKERGVLDESCTSDESTKCIGTYSQASPGSTVDQLSEQMSGVKLSSVDSQMSSNGSNTQSQGSHDFEYSTPSTLLGMRLSEEHHANFEMNVFGNPRFARSTDIMFVPPVPGRVQMVGGNHPEHVQQADMNRPSCSKTPKQASTSRPNAQRLATTSCSVADPAGQGKRQTLSAEASLGHAHHQQQKGVKSKNSRSVSEPDLDFYKRTQVLEIPKVRKRLFHGTNFESSEWLLIGNDSYSYTTTTSASDEVEDEDIFPVDLREGISTDGIELVMGFFVPEHQEMLPEDNDGGQTTQIQSGTNTCFRVDNNTQEMDSDSMSATGIEHVQTIARTEESSSVLGSHPLTSSIRIRSGRENPSPVTASCNPEHKELFLLSKSENKAFGKQFSLCKCSSQGSCHCKDKRFCGCLECKSSSSIPSVVNECLEGCVHNISLQPIPSDDLVERLETPTNSPLSAGCRHRTTVDNTSPCPQCSCQGLKKRPECAHDSHYPHLCTSSSVCQQSPCHSVSSDVENVNQDDRPRPDNDLRGRCTSQNCSASPDGTSESDSSTKQDEIQTEDCPVEFEVRQVFQKAKACFFFFKLTSNCTPLVNIKACFFDSEVSPQNKKKKTRK